MSRRRAVSNTDRTSASSEALHSDRKQLVTLRNTTQGTVNLMECGRNDARDQAGDTDGYAVAATPVTAAQV
jgi:hypothetical protein